ncbi:shootin-1-like isoform X2 [Ranitomeya imitator]|uniref:shootin-1-like isoform X2 n=1 Tax=Ranitomeya imitator TaxID=111125 RepID=UPI0037E85E96
MMAEAAGEMMAEAAGEMMAEAAGEMMAEAAGEMMAEAAGEMMAEAAGEMMAEAAGEADLNISCIEEELRQLTDLQLSSSSESDIISEDEDSRRQLEESADLSEKLLEELTILKAEYEAALRREKQAEEELTTQVQEGNENLNTTEVDQCIFPMQSEQPVDVRPAGIGDQPMAEVNTDSSYENQQIIEDLKENIQKLSKEKEQIASELQELRIQATRLSEKFENERREKEAICAKLEKSQNKFLKLNRVSLAVTREYADALDQLELEQSLREEAESYASKVLKEKKAISRQSVILMQSVQPNEMLIKALDDVRSLTITLEVTKQELLMKVASLELKLSERPTQEEFLAAKESLNVVNTEKSQIEEELKATKENCTLLEEKVKSLEEKLQRNEASAISMVAAPVSLPASPPPPPPPPPPAFPLIKAPEDPLAIIKQRRGQRKSEGSPVTGDPDVRADAVREMMERIKTGVVLRPARNNRKDQAVVTSKRKSVICQLQGILMDTARKPTRKPSRRRTSRKAKESELESVLQRRRRIVDIPQKTDSVQKTETNTVISEKNDSPPVDVTPSNDEDKSSSENQNPKTSDLCES